MGPFRAVSDANGRRVVYLGNLQYSADENISERQLSRSYLDGIVARLSTDESLYHLHKIDSAIFDTSIAFFRRIGADWCNLPLTTRMISSPGEVYRGSALDYTTDTLPVRLQWFDQSSEIFLAESSQFYLELRLLIPQIERVFAIYNSFRKEKADYTHLSEFQHIEFEGKVTFAENNQIVQQLVRELTKGVLSNALPHLQYFINDEDIRQREQIAHDTDFVQMSFREALQMLRQQTGDERYREFSLRHFGAWEEVFLSSYVGAPLVLTGFPLLEIPFYHDAAPNRGEEDAQSALNADFILPGYREVVGAGARVLDSEVLMQKAKVFHLPPEDYAPYLESRSSRTYTRTAGFGLGWQRYVHWLLKLPTIWDCCHIPRGHLEPRP